MSSRHEKDDHLRIGEQKQYTGVFALVQSDRFRERYVFPRIIIGDKTALTTIPVVALDDERGVYVGDGDFMIANGDVFREKPLQEEPTHYVSTKAVA